MVWLIALTVTAGVTAGVCGAFAWMYRRWWRDTAAQLDISRAAMRVLSARLAAYRVRAAAQLDEVDRGDRGDATPDATPGDRGGTTRDGVEGA